MTDLGHLSATGLLRLLAEGTTSSSELVEHFLQRLASADPRLGPVVVTLDEDGARAAAREADRVRASGAELGPLHGLPFTVKDSLSTAGVRTTAGAQELADHVPEVDAPVVARLRAAGAVLLGKTNLPAWASDWQCSNELFGRTANPWDPGRTPGGSSGGAAVAVASGLTGFDVGSDLGGSIRIPASWCGVYGLKPTWGVVPTLGHLPPPPGVLAQLDVAMVGPLARSAEDLDLLLSVMAGPDEARGRGWRLALPAPRAATLGAYRVGVWLDDALCSPESSVREVHERAVDALAGAGAQVVDVSPRLAPVFAETYELAQLLVQASVSPFLPDEEYDELAGVAGGPGDGPHERWARHVTASARDVLRAQERRLQLGQEWAGLFDDVDVVLCPGTPTTAPALDEGDHDGRTVGVDDPERPASEQFAWLQSIGTLHLPSVSAPVGFTPRGLPVGIQVVGPLHEDRTAVDVARRMADVVGGYEAPPL